jgi:hypothetical protein
VIDGEAVILGVDSVPDFNTCNPRRQDDEVQPSTFWRWTATIFAGHTPPARAARAQQVVALGYQHMP